MAQSISSRSDKATATTSKLVDQVWKTVRGELAELVASLSGDVTPDVFMEFELALSELVRELGRGIVEQATNKLEKDSQRRQVIYNGLVYRRLQKKTRNQNVSTLFGNICLTRFGYRYWDAKHVGEPCIFPLELRLGLMEGVTPALGVESANTRRDLRNSRPLTGCTRNIVSLWASDACGNSFPR